jgi:hypothetical protein
MPTNTMEILRLTLDHDPATTPRIFELLDGLACIPTPECPMCAALKELCPDGTITCKSCGRDDND